MVYSTYIQIENEEDYLDPAIGFFKKAIEI